VSAEHKSNTLAGQCYTLSQYLQQKTIKRLGWIVF